MLLAAIAWFWLPHGPASAWFLKPDEQIFVCQRILNDNTLYVAHESGEKKPQLTRRDVMETAKDWKLWFLIMCNICASVPSQALTVFLPMVVKGLGYSSVRANLVFGPSYPITRLAY